MKSEPPFDYVLHTASPFHFNVQDPEKDFLDPAIKGTTGVLASIKKYAPSVKRVVVTSSFAAIVNPAKHPEVYDETLWNPVTWEEAKNPSNTYRASKVKRRPFFSIVVGLTRKQPPLTPSGNRLLPRRQRGNLLKRRSRTSTLPQLTLPWSSGRWRIAWIPWIHLTLRTRESEISFRASSRTASLLRAHSCGWTFGMWARLM